MSEPRRIWLCADDYGLAPGVNAAIRDLIVRGRINATSVMVVAPSFDRSEALALDILNSGARRVAIGLHVTLTAPFAPLTQRFTPHRRGNFLPVGRSLVASVMRRYRHRRLAAEVAAQLAVFVTVFGRLPDFIDGHQHVQVFPQVRDAVLAVAQEEAPESWLRQCGRSADAARRGDRKALLLDFLSREFRRRADAAGLRTNPAFAGTYDFAAGVAFDGLFQQFLHGLPDEGLIMCHPGHVDAELTRLDPVTTQREREFAFFAGDVFPRLLAREGITLA